MTAPLLTVIVPVFNEAARIERTLDEIATAVLGSEAFRLDLLVVDDGSTDGTTSLARFAAERLGGRVITQSNQGRFAARRAGLDAARGEYVLLIDSRVSVSSDSLAFVAERLRAGDDVWNAHVDIDSNGNPYGRFWRVLVEAAWWEYFANPRTTSFGLADFDRFPKGTTCFLAPIDLVRDSFGAFRSRSYYDNDRFANDDTPLLRWIAERRPIHISPRFRATYTPRSTAAGFLRHAFHRGIVFVDGHGRSESRFFPVVVAFYPTSAASALLLLRRPGVALAVVGAASVVTAGVVRRRWPEDAIAFAALAPPYAIAHGLGMWKAAGLAIAKTLRARRST